MTHEEYERLYAEALELLRTTVVFDGPETAPDGTRFLLIDGTPLDDQLVFEMVWGVEMAQDIKSHRPLSHHR
jgi:hypothetical protein